MVTIPKDVAKAAGIRENELVKVEIEKVKADFFGALKGLGPFTKEDELRVHD
ncbi:MAG: AbrB/MazE/SpoVT family DNA-binding domain-containing protein [Euryarchaeota archaeon]|nr:AbrB/MazE/SpoVT family DNA-binding domain-containing protein [Euryarchaeota archaeon]